jgi:hypothetical protein
MRNNLVVDGRNLLVYQFTKWMIKLTIVMIVGSAFIRGKIIGCSGTVRQPFLRLQESPWFGEEGNAVHYCHRIWSTHEVRLETQSKVRIGKHLFDSVHI